MQALFRLGMKGLHVTLQNPMNEFNSRAVFGLIYAPLVTHINML